MPAAGRVLVTTPDDDGDAALRWAARLGFADATPTSAPLAAPADGAVGIARRPAAAVALPDALAPLARLDRRPPAGWPPWRALPDSVTVWAAVATAALRLVADHRVTPSLRHGPDGEVYGAWVALLAHDPDTADTLERLAATLPPAGHALARDDAHVWAAEALTRAFVDAVADTCVRHAVESPTRERPRARLLPWTERWREALADPDDASVPLRADEAGELVAGVQAWLQPTSAGDGHLALRLDAPSDPDGSWRLEFGVRAPDGTWRSALSLWRGGDDGEPLEEADRDALLDALLGGLGRLARVFDPVDAALADAEPAGCELDLERAWQLIDEVAPVITGGDIELALPPELVDRPRVRVRLDADGGSEDAADLDLGEAFGDDADAAATLEVAVDGETLDADELDALLRAEQPLVAWRDRWVPVDDEARRLLATATETTLPLRDALVWAMAGSAPLSALADVDGAGGDDAAVDVVADGRVARLLERLSEARESSAVDDVDEEPAGFEGTLRGYQRRGVAWLGAMAELGVGGVLADDMGLGKTVQLIGHLLRLTPPDGTGDPARADHRPHLVVCPTSVVGNWIREIERFAPGLPVTRFHGPERPQDLSGVSGVVVTSYGTLRRDPEPLVGVRWRVVALDEAQHVKNPSTAGARTVRRLESAQTVALTGTPLENRLTELWTLLDATNPGMLGSRSRFGRRFVGPIERGGDADAVERLRRLVAPFVLRRRKDDPQVLDDLPEKLERTVVAPLTAEQAQLYQAAVDRVLGDGLDQAGTMERRGRVLALLTELKQICNHPAQRRREESEASPVLTGRSGKLAAAREIVTEAVDAGEQVLVFTQFVAMGHLLTRQFSADLGVEVPLLHGGVAAAGRDRMVEDFQSGGPDTAPVMVVSLRAGGTGLNLTAATQVIHYDRWWNPAVEDQATDRAHRIGQTRRVMVHKLVTTGTVEERVAALLERKRALADSVVGSGEEWLTELDDAALADLVALSSPGEDIDDDPWQPWAEAS